MKIGKIVEYGNVLFYEHQVLENMGVGRRNVMFYEHQSTTSDKIMSS